MTGLGLGLGIGFSSGVGDLVAPLFGSALYVDIDPSFQDRLTKSYTDGSADKVTNGTFTTDSTWAKGTNWTIGSGVGNSTGSTAAQYIEQNCLVSGATYAITFTVAASSNTVTPYAGTAAGTAVGTGTYTQFITANGAALKFGGHASGFTGTIDNVSAIECPAVAVANEPLCAARMTADIGDACNLAKVSDATALKWWPAGWGGNGSLIANGSHYGTIDALAAKFTAEDSALCVIAVMRMISVVHNKFAWHVARSASPTPFRTLKTNGSDWRMSKRDNVGTLLDVDASTTINTDHTVVASYDTGTTVWLWKDGVVTAVNGDSFNVGAHTLNQFTFGAYRQGATVTAGIAYELRRVIVAGSPALADVSTVANDLTARYGI